jgi:hypothetical protein
MVARVDYGSGRLIVLSGLVKGARKSSTRRTVQRGSVKPENVKHGRGDSANGPLSHVIAQRDTRGFRRRIVSREHVIAGVAEAPPAIEVVADLGEIMRDARPPSRLLGAKRIKRDDLVRCIDSALRDVELDRNLTIGNREHEAALVKPHS